MLKLDSKTTEELLKKQRPWFIWDGQEVYRTVNGNVLLNKYGEYYSLTEKETSDFVSQFTQANIPVDYRCPRVLG